MVGPEDSLPPDMEPLDDGDQFYVELCELIDDHAQERDMSREKLLYHLGVFREDWMNTFSATGAFWQSPRDGIRNVHNPEE